MQLRDWHQPPEPGCYYSMSFTPCHRLLTGTQYFGELFGSAVQYYVESRKVVAKEAGVATPAKTVAAEIPLLIQAA